MLVAKPQCSNCNGAGTVTRITPRMVDVRGKPVPYRRGDLEAGRATRTTVMCGCLRRPPRSPRLFLKKDLAAAIERERRKPSASPETIAYFAQELSQL